MKTLLDVFAVIGGCLGIATFVRDLYFNRDRVAVWVRPVAGLDGNAKGFVLEAVSLGPVPVCIVHVGFRIEMKKGGVVRDGVAVGDRPFFAKEIPCVAEHGIPVRFHVEADAVALDDEIALRPFVRLATGKRCFGGRIKTPAVFFRVGRRVRADERAFVLG